MLDTNLPVATNDTSVTPINTPVVIQVESNDGPGNIGGVLGNATTVTAPTNGVAVINPDGTITYTPNAGYFGPDSFEYTICETPSGLCSTATVDVTVLPVGSPNTVLASDDYDTTTGVIPATGTVVTNDTNPDDLSAIAAVTQNVVLAEGTFVLNADGTYVFTPATGFSGTVNIPYTITDSGSPVATSTATLHIVVSILPVTTPDVNAGNVGDEIPGNVATNDEVPAGTTYGPATGLPGNPDGTLPVINPVTGSYTFTPTLPGVYAFDVPVCVPGGPIPCPTVPLVITIVNPLLDTNLPVATNDTSVTPINTPVVIQVESNDGPG
ncbi:MAG: Ig-like domain-containing protein, partial [Cyclobacteriaceae bacterium]|nr:Ig-like domain-containing protein [Cyclobacteriaceae bacterium]